MAHSNLSKPEIESLVESICSENGLNDQTSYNFEDFCQLLSPQMDKIWNAGLEWKGTCARVISLFSSFSHASKMKNKKN